jgi:PAS domain-containing protein
MSFLTRKQIYSENSVSEQIDGLFALRDSVIEGQKIVLIFDDNGTICDCNEAGAKLLECMSSELIGQPISSVLPELTEIKLFQGTQSIPKLLFLSRIGHHFEVVRMFGTRFAGNLFFSDVYQRGQHRLRVIICPVENRK